MQEPEASVSSDPRTDQALARRSVGEGSTRTGSQVSPWSVLLSIS